MRAKEPLDKARTSVKSTSALPRPAPLSITIGSVSMSDLRQQQLQELEKIRLLFEQNNLTFSDEAFQRGLLVPEDRPVLDCVHNLPLAGSRLVPNPLVDLRMRKGLPKKKKKNGGLKKKKKKTVKSSKTPKSGRVKLKS
ncbi:unnamed protein product [Globisporangium polare]